MKRLLHSIAMTYVWPLRLPATFHNETEFYSWWTHTDHRLVVNMRVPTWRSGRKSWIESTIIGRFFITRDWRFAYRRQPPIKFDVPVGALITSGVGRRSFKGYTPKNKHP